MSNFSFDDSRFAFDEPEFHKQIPHPLINTNLKGTFTGPPPPEHFDPRTATQAELWSHGMRWRKPIVTDPPALHRAWDRMFSREWSPKNQIIPELHPQIGRTHTLKSPGVQRSDGTFVGNGWAGVCGFNGNWAGVMAVWDIPTVSVPTEPQGQEGGWNSATWVGLDGYNVAGVVSSNNVLQAGVEQRVDSEGNPSYTAWYEWFSPQEPNSPSYIWQTNIPNFLVQPGQKVFCSVQYINRNAGYIFFANWSTGQYFPMTLAPPPGADTRGVTCEWIVEAPDQGLPNSSLPKFTPVVFTAAIACEPNWGLLTDTTATNPNTLNVLDIQDANGVSLTSASAGNFEVTIDFIG